MLPHHLAFQRMEPRGIVEELDGTLRLLHCHGRRRRSPQLRHRQRTQPRPTANEEPPAYATHIPSALHHTPPAVPAVEEPQVRAPLAMIHQVDPELRILVHHVVRLRAAAPSGGHSIEVVAERILIVGLEKKRVVAHKEVAVPVFVQLPGPFQALHVDIAVVATAAPTALRGRQPEKETAVDSRPLPQSRRRHKATIVAPVVLRRMRQLHIALHIGQRPHIDLGPAARLEGHPLRPTARTRQQHRRQPKRHHEGTVRHINRIIIIQTTSQTLFYCPATLKKTTIAIPAARCVSTGGIREGLKRYIIRHFLYRSYIVLIYFSYTSYIGDIRSI